VNVAVAPEQIVVGDWEMLTDGALLALTVTVNEQFIEGVLFNAYVTVVTPGLNVFPLAVPVPVPIVAPVRL
jgi:hypothetical protein